MVLSLSPSAVRAIAIKLYLVPRRVSYTTPYYTVQPYLVYFHGREALIA